MSWPVSVDPKDSVITRMTCIPFQVLLVAKAVAVGLSESISIISSLVDSAVDLLSGIIIWWTSRAMKKKNIYRYPGGIKASILFPRVVLQ